MFEKKRNPVTFEQTHSNIYMTNGKSFLDADIKGNNVGWFYWHHSYFRKDFQMLLAVNIGHT